MQIKRELVVGRRFVIYIADFNTFNWISSDRELILLNGERDELIVMSQYCQTTFNAYLKGLLLWNLGGVSAVYTLTQSSGWAKCYGG